MLAIGCGNDAQALLKTLWRDVSGQDTTEYALLVLLVALAATMGMMLLATSISDAFAEASSVLDGGGSVPPPVP